MAARAEMIAQAEAALKASPPGTATGGGATALPLFAYAGKYEDPWYGGMTVSEHGAGTLAISFDRTPGMTGILEPVGGNRYRTRWTDRAIEDAYLTFTVSGGKVTTVAMKAVSPLADFSFDYQDLRFVRTAP